MKSTEKPGIKLTDMDNMIDTEQEWNSFVESLEGINQLVIEIQKFSTNPIIREYRIATLQACCYRLSYCETKIYLKSENEMGE